MPKIDINKAAEAMKHCQVEASKIREVVEMLNEIVSAEGKEEKPVSIKKQFGVIILDSDELFFKFCADNAWAPQCLVVQLPESESPSSLITAIGAIIGDYNATRNGRMYPMRTIGDAAEGVPAKFWKDKDVWLKTKTPVQSVIVDNQL